MSLPKRPIKPASIACWVQRIKNLVHKAFGESCNVFTGGGVTAGIDMALAVMAEIAGQDVAEAVQLGLEYAPEPPFDSGRPERARPEIVAAVRGRFDRVWPERLAAARRAAAALDGGRAPLN